MRSIGLALVLTALLAAAPAAAGDPAPDTAVLAFDAFLARSAPVCERQAAARCVEAGWRFADRDRSRDLSLAELQAVRGEFVSWIRWKEQDIPPGQRGRILLGLVIFDLIGLPRLFELYDEDRNGAISRAELLSDVRLDERPLEQVLNDRHAVDWRSIRRRLGALAPALDAIEPEAED